MYVGESKREERSKERGRRKGWKEGEESKICVVLICNLQIYCKRVDGDRSTQTDQLEKETSR